MRVVHFGKYYPPEHGGIEYATHSLAQNARNAGCEVAVICFVSRDFGKAGGKAADSMEAGVRVVRHATRYLIASQPLAWGYFLSLVRWGRQADVVHVHAPNMLGALAVLWLRRRNKVLVHWHSDVVGKGLLGLFSRPLERAFLARADAVVCTSKPYAASSKVLSAFQSKVHAIPIGMGDPATVPRQSVPTALMARIGTRKVILSVGRLVPYKGFDVLIKAAREMPPDAVVVIVGEGPERLHLDKLVAELEVASRVILAGRLGKNELVALYQMASLACLSSVERSEAFGVVLVEAMSHGLPLVATNIPGSGVQWVNAHEVSGLNVEVGDACALAAACRTILADAALHRRFSLGARERYLSLFTEAATSQAYLHLYGKLTED